MLRLRPPLLLPRALEEPDLPRVAVERLALPLLPDLPDVPAELRELEEPADFARVEPDLEPPELDRELLDFAPPDFALDLLAPDLEPLDFAALPREPLDWLPLDRELRAPPELLPPDEPASSLHLPDSTRCAASATASAISEPSRVALDTAALAALLAVSAASRPASRILRRAAGLALIAAAAAARPAASISRLIAALVILSTVLSLEPDEPEEFLFLLDFAIAGLPLSQERHFKAVTVP